MNNASYNRRDFLKAVGFGGAALAMPGMVQSRASQAESAPTRPNFIIVFADDLGFSDVGCYGGSIETPRVDRMAREGMRFTSFYAQTVCGPSRAALMTGCYPLRVARKNNRIVRDNGTPEVHPRLHTKEITIAEVLKQAGYATGAFGKWDLAGHSQTAFAPELMPNKQGFDFFFGTPSSNDSFVNLYRNGTLIEKKADMNLLTNRYTEEAVDFIEAKKDEPFFVYLAHTMPHTKLGASEQFRGKSRRGLYGDVVRELDWSLGRILDTVKTQGLDARTYVIFTSDNGPWLIKGPHGGGALPLRGGKTSSWEGGFRVPCIVRAPGRIAQGVVCDEIATTMDFLPTLARLAGVRIPADRVIDGHDITALLHGKKEPGPTEAFFYYIHTHLQAVRSGKWKLHLPRPANPPWTPNWARHIDAKDVFEITQPMLFDLESDIGEQHDVAENRPEVVERLLKLAEHARKDIGDYDRIGDNARFFDPQPRRPDAARWEKSRMAP